MTNTINTHLPNWNNLGDSEKFVILLNNENSHVLVALGKFLECSFSRRKKNEQEAPTLGGFDT